MSYFKQRRKKALTKQEQGKEKKNEIEKWKEDKLCLIVEKNEIYFENSSKFIFDKLLDIFHELMDDFKKIRLKNKELKK